MKNVLFVLVIFALLITACQDQTVPTIAVPVVTNTPEVKSSPTDVPPTKVVLPTPDPNLMYAGDLAKGFVLDPAITTDAAVLDACDYLYQGLVVTNEKGEVAPGIATAWSISDDELDVVFTLRRGGTFSDGTPIDADVVVENFYRWFDPNHPLHKDGVYQGWKDNFLGFLGEVDAEGKPISIIDGLEKVDNYTVLLHLNRRDPEILQKLAQPYFSILKPALLQAGNAGSNSGNTIANGAYRVAEWAEAGLILEPNPTYWGEQPKNKLQFGIK